MGTQVITRDSGRRLGVVGEVVVDIDRREVVALGLRDNPLTRFLPGLPRWMPLDRIRQVGDVILVDSADSLAEGFDPERYSKVINCQVITESGQQLGRVLGYSFDIETGELTTLVLGALGVPLLGEGVLSTWELAVGEIVSSGADRIIVYEGAEEKLKQLGTGLLEKLGIGGGGLEQEERERFRSTLVPAENQLPAGVPSQQEQRRIQPSTATSLPVQEDLDYVELEERRQREPLRQRRYLDEDEISPRGLEERRPYPTAPEPWERGDQARDDWDSPREWRPEEREATSRFADTMESSRRDQPRRPRDLDDADNPLDRRERLDNAPALEAPTSTRRPWDADLDADRQVDDRLRQEPMRRPLNLEEPEPRQSSERPRRPLQADRPGRRPLDAEPLDVEPVDVEPEVLDDPW